MTKITKFFCQKQNETKTTNTPPPPLASEGAGPGKIGLTDNKLKSEKSKSLDLSRFEFAGGDYLKRIKKYESCYVIKPSNIESEQLKEMHHIALEMPMRCPIKSIYKSPMRGREMKRNEMNNEYDE